MPVIITLQQILDEQKMSQRELSKRSGVRQMTINVMCNNTAQRIDKFHLDKICEVLNCDISDILKRVTEGEK